MELKKQGVQVILLEAGSREFSDESQNLYEAHEIDVGPGKNDYDPDYTRWSRLRFYGGATNHWGGWCRPLEKLDFEERSWMAMSGWPLKRAELNRFYADAAKVVEIEPFELESEDKWLSEAEGQSLFPRGIHNPQLETRLFHYSPPTRFKDKYGPELESSTNVKVIWNANVLRFETQPGGEHVKRVVVQNYKGRKFTVEANQFVLACGGIENPRLLLNSTDNHANGLGNHTDWVGRCYMDHPHVEFGVFYNLSDQRWHEAFGRKNGEGPMRVFSPSENFQAQAQILNFSCALGKFSKTLEGTEEVKKLSQWTGLTQEDVGFVQLYCRSEMEPQRGNRIYLSDEVDALGMRKLSMHVRYSELDRDTVAHATSAVIRFLSAQSKGRGRFTVDEPEAWPNRIGGGCHHMGTTRMSANAADGVVDPNCKVHGISNLYVAGSSVFSTGGFANPTLTIVALSLRLGQHLTQKEQRHGN